MSDKKLWDQYVAMEKERDALRAKIESMEKQEPVTAQQRFQRQQEMMAVWQPWQTTELRKGRPARTVDVLGLNVEYRELYALPGAAPEPSESEARMRWLLRQIVHALPSRRDWLDPAIEREARIATTVSYNGLRKN